MLEFRNIKFVYMAEGKIFSVTTDKTVENKRVKLTVENEDGIISPGYVGGAELAKKRCPRTSPGTMESLTIPKDAVAALSAPVEVRCEHEEALA